MINQIITYFNIAYHIHPIGQSIGFIAFILWMIAFLNKNDYKTKFIHWISLIFLVIHYFIIWLYTWLICDLIGWFRNFSSIKYKWNNKIFILFITIYIISWFLSYDNIFSTLPIISWILATIWFFYLEWVKMRLVLLITPILWLFYDYFWHSIGWTFIDLFFILAHSITIIRLLIDKKYNKILI